MTSTVTLAASPSTFTVTHGLTDGTTAQTPDVTVVEPLADQGANGRFWTSSKSAATAAATLRLHSWKWHSIFSAT